jgi:hypothetical protein
VSAAVSVNRVSSSGGKIDVCKRPSRAYVPRHTTRVVTGNVEDRVPWVFLMNVQARPHRNPTVPPTSATSLRLWRLPRMVDPRCAPKLFVKSSICVLDIAVVAFWKMATNCIGRCQEGSRELRVATRPRGPLGGPLGGRPASRRSLVRVACGVG